MNKQQSVPLCAQGDPKTRARHRLSHVLKN